MTSLFSSYKLGRIELRNRIVMAPLTRSRAVGNIVGALQAEYYSQRAAAGLIITEGTSPSPNGLGYARIPGMYSKEQIAGWRIVTDAVHKAVGHVFVQLMHTGRVTHQANLPAGATVLAPSALQAPGQMYTDSEGMQPHSVPHAMNSDEIATTRNEYILAATSAIAAGFDGLELHGANGYLLEQFLNTASNQRTDEYGGSVENRARFVLEVARGCAEAIGANRVGIRVSPYGANGGMVADAQTDELYTYLATELSKLGLLYIHVVDHSSMGAPQVSPSLKASIRKNFKGTYILSGGYDRTRAEADLTEGKGDLVAFGRPFLSNPDLVDKLEHGKPLRAPDFNTAYTPGPVGYTDWPRG